MKVIPITLREANAFVDEHHRHHKATQGCKFALGLLNGETFCRVVNEIAELVIDDSKSDREIVYAKHVIDTRLASIVGDENFVPFDQRYGGGNGK